MQNVFRREARPCAAVALAVLAAAVSARSASADFIVGGMGNDNLFPLGTSAFYTGEYQQLYAASAFSSPFNVTSLGFESAVIRSPGSETLNLTIGLSTTSASLAAPSGTYAANKGADFKTVFSGPVTFTALANGTFDLVIPVTPFTYDPSKGNLLVDIIAGTSSGSGIASFTFGPSTNVSRVFNLGGIPGSTEIGISEGLLTRFGAAAVPEPASLVAFGTGALLLLAGYRRRLRVC
jgi:hypothetical protein